MANTTASNSKPKRRINPLSAGISTGASLLFIAALWLLFAPVNLGGNFAYFFVAGNSMEPHITSDDLVLLRAADRYDVGDVIGFRDPQIGTVVHRIRALDGDRYITRGDNRDSDDPNRPFHSDVVGKEWHVLNGAAGFVRTLQSPKSAVLLTVASIAFGMMSAKPAATRRMRQRLGKKAPAWVGQMSYKSMNGDQIVTLASTLLFTAIGLGAVILWNGSERTVTKDIVLEQTGRLQYTAAAGTGLYDDDKVVTGQPVFTQIGTQMPVSFTYEVTPSSKDATVGGVKGMVRLYLELSQENQWTREYEIVPPTPFAGTTATAQGVVDLKVLQDVAARMEQAALLKYPMYSVRVLAEVKANGNISGRAQDYTFNAKYPFELHELQLIPAPKFEAKAETPLNVKRDSVEPWSTTLPIVGTRIDYTTLQVLTIVLAIAGGGALALVYASTMVAARSGETALILSRYAPLLVSVQAADVDFGGRIVAVKKFDDLMRMARADGLFVVHAENGVADHFLLVTPEVTYLYSVPRPPEKFRFDEEIRPSPNEALAGLARPDMGRPLPAPAMAMATGGAVANGVGAAIYRNGAATPPAAAPVASTAAPAPAEAASSRSSASPSALPAQRMAVSAPGRATSTASTATPPTLTSAPANTASPVTGARPLSPMAAQQRSSASTARPAAQPPTRTAAAAMPAAAAQATPATTAPEAAHPAAPRNTPPNPPVSGGKALV
jgi:signal peptidase I